MNTDLTNGYALLKDVLDLVREDELSKCEVIIFAPFVHLKVFQNSLNGSGIALGAQNCHQEKSGAYTGEISAEMLASIPVEYILIGHSERRQFCGETNEMLAQKINRAFEENIKAVYCFGETLEERESNHHFAIVEAQLREGLSNLTKEQMAMVVVAYEPVWAIGTGKTASAEQAQEIHAKARTVLADMFGEVTAAATRILYGGSVKPSNATELFNMQDIDGGLIGGAALDATAFSEIVKA